MKIFLLVIEVLTMVAVFITAIRMYLTVNKMWKRKHEKSVAESVSLFAYFLAIFVHFSFMSKYIFVDGSPMPALNEGINILGYLVVMVIGIGFWVKENKNLSFFTLLGKALHLERKESGDLIKALIQPTGAKQIMEILEKVAYIDNELAKEEIELVSEFAKRWKVEVPTLKEWAEIGQTNLLDIRSSMVDYLDIRPPKEQAAQLVDVISLLIKADKIVTKEEELFLGEVKGMVNDYIHKNEKMVMYHVLIVPQNDQQFDAIKTLFPNVEPEDRRGGKVVVRGKFYSKDYADAICQKYIALGMFSIWEECEF